MKDLTKTVSEKAERVLSFAHQNEAGSFRALCETIQKISETRSVNTKIAVCTEYLTRLERDEDLNLAARFIGEGAFDSVSSKRASVGSHTSATAAAEFCEIDYERVFKPSRAATGSSSETIEKLMANLEAAQNKRNPELIALSEVDRIFKELAQVSGRAEKKEILVRSWKKMTPVEIKYFIRMLGSGSLRIGFEVHSVVSSIAKAFNKKPAAVRYVHMITGSIGKTAVLAKKAKLDEAEFRLFHPIPFMLASAIEKPITYDLSGFIAEEKFDGMRCQAHVDGNKVRLYSRDLNDITKSFPDIIEFFIRKNLPPAILDGEICVFKNETIQPSQFLQERMASKKTGKEVRNEFPVLFIAYDLLYTDGFPVFDKTLEDRRKLLETFTADYQLPISRQIDVRSIAHVEKLVKRAVAHGNEGLMLKEKVSKYEYGERRKSWLKVKKTGGSLTAVIMYAHAVSGQKGETLSDFTLGISVRDDERYEEKFIPIGKVCSGYSDDELIEMNKKVKELTVERYGPTLGLIPELIVEIEFDHIQPNPRTKAGYTLQLPRFKAIRRDLSPDDTDTLKDVERLYQKKIVRKRLKQDKNPSFLFAGPMYVDD